MSCHYGFTNYFEILIFFCAKNSFNMLNYLSRISTLRNINLTSKNHKIQFFSLFGWFFLNFAFKTHGTLKMLILGAQDNFHFILSYYVEGHLKKIQIWISFFPMISRPRKSWFFLETYTVQQVLKPFSDRYNPLGLPGFGLANMIPRAVSTC